MRRSEYGDIQIRGSPTQLQFYPARWRELLESAKIKFRFYLTVVKSFPTREEGIAEAGDCILEALSEYRDAGKTVERGT